ncbi:hypothetical protein KEJ47_07745 [Candidatus Bathyarchaeota archaeon]|nr:hypothetical protein [Candidatus Bathyarchaeota archaeon]
MNERELKDYGEKLAREAAKADVGSKQMRELFHVLKTKSLPYFEAHVKNQIARSIRGGAKGGPKGFDVFGPKILEAIKEFGDDKGGLLKALEYANMLYDYEKMSMESVKEPRQMKGEVRSESLEVVWKPKLEGVLRSLCAEYGFSEIGLEQQKGMILCRVYLRRFGGNPAELASDLYREVLYEYPELSGKIRFWIEKA